MSKNNTSSVIKIKRWVKEKSNRRAYIGSVVVAISDGENTITEVGNDTEDAATKIINSLKL